MIKQAVILAGGKGLRLKPLTKNIPKPMVKVNGIPFLDYLIFNLKKSGIKKILILVGYKFDKITNYYKTLRYLKFKFNYSPVKSNTGKRLLDAYKYLDNEFLLLYGDNYWEPNLKKMYKRFQSKKAFISTTVFNNKLGNAEYGKENNVFVKNDNFIGKYDKTRKNKKLNGVDIGFFLIKKNFLNKFIFKKKNYSLENDILLEAIKLNKLIAYKTDRQYFSITNLDMLKKFEKIAIKRKLKYIKYE